MSYARQTWVDNRIGATPVDAARLNYMEAGIASANTQLDARAARALQALLVAGPVNIDATTGKFQEVTLQANGTAGTITGLVSGQEIVISFIQDATGGRTYLWPTAPVIKWAGATAPTASTVAARRDIVGFYFDGTALRELYRTLNQN